MCKVSDARGGMVLPVAGRIDLTLERRVIFVKNSFCFDEGSKGMGGVP